MRYSIDPAGVTDLISEVAVLGSDLEAHTSASLQALTAVEGALLRGAARVRAALDEVFARRRFSAAAVSTRLSEIVAGIESATLAYVAGDEEMLSRTAASLPAVIPQPVDVSEYLGAFSGRPR